MFLLINQKYYMRLFYSSGKNVKKYPCGERLDNRKVLRALSPQTNY